MFRSEESELMSRQRGRTGRTGSNLRSIAQRVVPSGSEGGGGVREVRADAEPKEPREPKEQLGERATGGGRRPRSRQHSTANYRGPTWTVGG